MSISQSPWAENNWELKGVNLVLPLVEAAHWPRKLFVLTQDSGSDVLCQAHFSASFWIFSPIFKGICLVVWLGYRHPPCCPLKMTFSRISERCSRVQRKKVCKKAVIFVLPALLTWRWWGLKVWEGFVTSMDRQQPWLYQRRLLCPSIPGSLASWCKAEKLSELLPKWARCCGQWGIWRYRSCRTGQPLADVSVCAWRKVFPVFLRQVKPKGYLSYDKSQKWNNIF